MKCAMNVTKLLCVACVTHSALGETPQRYEADLPRSESPANPMQRIEASSIKSIIVGTSSSYEHGEIVVSASITNPLDVKTVVGVVASSPMQVMGRNMWHVVYYFVFLGERGEPIACLDYIHAPRVGSAQWREVEILGPRRFQLREPPSPTLVQINGLHNRRGEWLISVSGLDQIVQAYVDLKR